MSKRAAEREAKRLGVTLSENEEMGRIFADAPVGFTMDGLHVMVSDWGPEYGPKADAWADLAERMGHVRELEACAEDCECRDEIAPGLSLPAAEAR
jgi:hypothetical protein